MRRHTIAVAMLALAMPFAADAMRCGQDLVSKGDHITDVHAKCGEPIRTIKLTNRHGAQVGLREVYDSSRGTRKHEVTYRSDRVVDIERLSGR